MWILLKNLVDFYFDSRRDYERALHLDPMCLPARVNLAYNMQVCGKHQQAWEQFTACLDINPGEYYAQWLTA